MKVIVNEKAIKKESKYPYLGISKDGLIILFAKQQYGTVINKIEGNHSIGYHSDCWIEEGFELFHGEIVLSNS
jgi:hypothetical protein